MVQHDTKGEVLFLHRNQMKLTGEPNTNQATKQVQPDELPDPVMWTHLLSFRKGSPRSEGTRTTSSRNNDGVSDDKKSTV
ncbi:hypothetical protein V7S43_016345 [Phytophthora oleae]|uniref:Uncharacterized protein n=1 Tax=Phytophthora oleae TaxID=2107226 RepID=A0ABD3EW18_9STRA